MEKLTDYVKQGCKPTDLLNNKQSDELLKVLKEFKILELAFNYIMKSDINSDDIDIFQEDILHKLASIIDNVFHKENIITRTLMFNTSMMTLYHANNNLIKHRVTLDVIKDIDIDKIVSDAVETQRKQQNN